MDFHKFDGIEGISIDAVKEAHTADLATQDKYNVKYHQFWVNEKAGTVFCLMEGPDAKTCELVHQVAHGNIACAITEVEQGYYKLLMGDRQVVDRGVVKNEDGTLDIGFRNILVVSLRGVTDAKSTLDIPLLQIPQLAKEMVSRKIQHMGGREIRWISDDSIIGVFNDASDAVICATHIKSELVSHESKVISKMGISAGQPVTEDGSFFTQAIKLAHRLGTIVQDNGILASSLAKKLCKDDVIRLSPFIKFLDVSDEQFVCRLLDITDQNLADTEFNIKSICKDIGVSRPQLYRKMISVTGRAPNYFLRDLRMEKALSLLKQKSANISQVALEVGYNSPSYFAKCFVNKFGLMPSEV